MNREDQYVRVSSMVSMADMTKKDISDMCINDCIRSNEFNITPVLDIYKGLEKEVVKIETISGKQIELCKNHPILTTQGFVSAIKITTSSMLVLFDNIQEQVKSVEVVPNLNSFKFFEPYFLLEIKEDGYIINDFIVGSFHLLMNLSR